MKIGQLTARRTELLAQISEKLHVTAKDVERALENGILTGTRFIKYLLHCCVVTEGSILPMCRLGVIFYLLASIS